MVVLLGAILYIYIGSTISLFAHKAGWFTMPAFGGIAERMFARILIWPIIIISIPLILSYERHKEDKTEE